MALWFILVFTGSVKDKTLHIKNRAPTAKAIKKKGGGH